jgi:hypothetical protein
MNYGKSLAAVAAAIISAVIAALTGDQAVTASEWVNVILAGVAAAAVFTAPNVPGARYTKVVLAVAAAVGALLASFVTDGGVSGTEWLQLLLAGLGAVGVYAAPYSPTRAGIQVQGVVR